MHSKRNAILLVLSGAMLSLGATERLQDSTAMFTDNALQQVNYTLVSNDIATVLTACERIFKQTETFLQKTKALDSADTRAVIKRFEITQRLHKYICTMQKGDAGQKLLAWQAAKEMTRLLDYFENEAKRFGNQSALPPAIILSIKNYGAVGDGKTDDGPAFRKAIEAAKSFANKPVELHVPAGTYRIAPDTKPLPQNLAIRMADMDNSISTRPGQLARAHLLLTNIDHIALCGEKGTTLLFTDSTMLGIRLLGCRESAIKNIAINYEQNTSTQGQIVKIEKNPMAMILQIAPGFPAPDDPRFLHAPSRRFSLRYPGKEELYGFITGRVGKVERMPTNTFRIFPLPHEVKHPSWTGLKSGMKLSIIARYDPLRYDASAVDLRYCRFCRLENVTIYKSPGVGFRLFRNYALILSGNRIETAPGVPDYVSCNADGSQCSGVIGPYVENCYFSKMEDDGFNFFSPTVELAKVSADRRFSLPFASDGAFLISGVTGEIKACLQPLSLSPKKYLAPLPDNYITNAKLQTMTLEEKLRQDYFGANAGKFMDRPDRLVLMPSDLSGTVVVNSEFYNIRGLALQITAPNVLVENCKINYMSGFGININVMLPWGMCFNPHNVVVKNCQLGESGAPAISLQFRGLNANTVPRPRNIQDILVENCTIKQKTWCAIEVRNAGNVTLSGNQIMTQNSASKAIYCKNFRDLTINACTFVIPNEKNAIFCKNPQEKQFIIQNNNKIK